MEILVPYRGHETIRGLVSAYTSAHDAITDDNFPTKRDGDAQLKVEFFTLPGHMEVNSILFEINHLKMRPLNAAETLALGLTMPDRCYVGYGQVYRASLFHVIAVYQREARLTGYNGQICAGSRIPMTVAEDASKLGEAAVTWGPSGAPRTATGWFGG